MKILLDPLLHFFALGAVVFAVFAWLDDGGGDHEIIVTRGQQANLIATFESSWQRLPTAGEYDGLLRDFIRQEIAYREAAAMGLDRGDIVIRRRMRQKLELLTEDLASLAPPTEAELDAWFAGHAANYRTEPRYSFEQIFFSTDRRGAAARADAMALLALLESHGKENERVGDPISLPRRFDDSMRSEVEASFGSGFADSLAELPLDRWAGPVESGFGLHLVRISASSGGGIPERAEVAQQVLRDLSNHRRERAVDELYARLSERYVIQVEPLDSSGRQ